MRNRLAIALLALALSTACGGGKAAAAKVAELEARNQELTQQVTKLENALNETKLQLVKQQQAMQTMNDRLRTVELGMDKLAYGSAATPR